MYKKKTPKRVTVPVPPLIPPLTVPVSEDGNIDTAAVLHILSEVRLARKQHSEPEEDDGPTSATSSGQRVD
jgi:hypothetical protein